MKRLIIKKMSKIIISAVLLLVFENVSAQDGYTVKKNSLQSDILKQNRNLSIFLPEGYDTNDTKFPVIYVLDGDRFCQHTVPTARFLFLNNKMPKAIIIGVSNVDRNYDFLPNSSQNGGGADNFIRFFRKELIPFIDKKYKTKPFRILVGYSLGGVFVMHTLLTDPDLFDAYLAIDPSLSYKNGMMIENAQTELLKAKNWNKYIFISGREGVGMRDMGISSIDSLLRKSAPQALNWKVVPYINENHGSIPFKSVYDGFRFIFDVGVDFKVFPQGGIIPEGSSTYALIINNNRNLRYTTDGTEPTINSSLCTETIKIENPCILKVKSVLKTHNNTNTVTRIFNKGDFMSAPKSNAKFKSGLKYSYFEGVWDSLPDFSKLTAIKTGYTDMIDLTMALKKDSFAIRFEGYILIKEKALHNLWIKSDNGSKVFFNNKLLLNDNGHQHIPELPVVNLVPLKPGYYPIEVQYFQKTGNKEIVLGYIIGNQKPVPIPKEMLFFKDN